MNAFFQGYMHKAAKVTLDLDIGDVVMTGRYKNKRTVVKELGTDELGMPTMNGQKLLALRIEKLLPKKMWSSKTLAEMKEKEASGKLAALQERRDPDNLYPDRGGDPYLTAIDRHVADLGIDTMYMDEDNSNTTWIKQIGHDNVLKIDKLMKAEGWGQ